MVWPMRVDVSIGRNLKTAIVYGSIQRLIISSGKRLKACHSLMEPRLVPSAFWLKRARQSVVGLGHLASRVERVRRWEGRTMLSDGSTVGRRLAGVLSLS